jgi:hypothetical protein
VVIFFSFGALGLSVVAHMPSDIADMPSQKDAALIDAFLFMTVGLVYFLKMY